MNAQERLAKAMFARTALPDDVNILWQTLHQRRRAVWLQNADAVLAVLPDLLTDLALLQLVNEAGHVAQAFDDYDDARIVSGDIVAEVLAAAAKALTGGQP